MHQLWVVSKEDGIEIYGDDYIDIWTMNKLHHLGGSAYTCDHVRLFNVEYTLFHGKLYLKQRQAVDSTCTFFAL